jgi:hypothetical protein
MARKVILISVLLAVWMLGSALTTQPASANGGAVITVEEGCGYGWGTASNLTYTDFFTVCFYTRTVFTPSGNVITSFRLEGSNQWVDNDTGEVIYEGERWTRTKSFSFKKGTEKSHTLAFDSEAGFPLRSIVWYDGDQIVKMHVWYYGEKVY